ncbi:MAG: glycosyltransferase [Candidatus Binataceae bacterium]
MGEPAVSIVTVAYDGYFFVRLLVEKVREFIGPRQYEIVVVDRGSRDGTRAWLRKQPDVRVVIRRQWSARHDHGEAAEAGVRSARHERIVLLDSDAHPLDPGWLRNSVDRLDHHNRISGAIFRSPHRGNPQGWYVHPHFMTFFREDLGGLIVLRKMREDDTDTGEEATLLTLAAGHGIIGHEIKRCERFAVGHPSYPSVAGGVFHAWYVTRLARDEAAVAAETHGLVTSATYLEPLLARLRQHYRLEY